jgi:hypothetical protein
MNQSWSIYHTKSTKDIDSHLHLYNSDSKVNTPSLGTEPVATKIPNVTLSALAFANFKSIWEQTLQFNTSFATVFNYRFNLKQSGILKSRKVVYISFSK